MRAINEIIIHCSATPPEMDINLAEIRRWHTNPRVIVDGKNIGGNGWSDIGYHYVICRSGLLEVGRPLKIAGAHARGHNLHSIGTCMVGGIDRRGTPSSNFTRYQWRRLDLHIRTLLEEFPDARVIGHNQVSSKACPSFDVGAWWVPER